MAGEYRRIRARKRVKLPNGVEVQIPVLASISFVDPRDRYQETAYGIDNTQDADRDVHVDDVYPVAVDGDGKPTQDEPTQDKSGDPLKVERVDTWKILDPRSRYQESRVAFDNKTGAELIPPSFTQHQKTHIYRYFKDPEKPSNDSAWIDVEWIDELGHVDPRTRYQETVATLTNPTNAEFRGGDLSGQVSQDDPDITIGDGEGTADNPVRLDPFQNIVNFKSTWKRDRQTYYVLTRTSNTWAYPYCAPAWGDWTGPFTYVYGNTYNPLYDPPDPEPSDGPPPCKIPGGDPYEIALVEVRTYSEKTFERGWADWLCAGGNSFLLTSSFWLDAYSHPGWRYVFVASPGWWPEGLYDIYLGWPLPPGWPPDNPPGMGDPHPPLPPGY